MEYPTNKHCHVSGSKHVTVLLLRHGEREDEAMKKSMSMEERKRYSLLPRSIRREHSMDPSLTRKGYEQASTAWQNILNSLQQRGTETKVTIVCSPLRRCIGTALMMSNTPPNGSALLDWWSLYPFWNDMKVVPILVMNGLCSCASAIERFDGNVLQAIQDGCDIPCAVLDGGPEALHNASIRFNAEVQNMIHISQKNCDGSMLQFIGFQAFLSNPAENETPFASVPLTQPLSTLAYGLSSTNSHKQRTSDDDDAIPNVALPSSFSTPPQKYRKAHLTTSSDNDHIKLSGMEPCRSHQDYGKKHDKTTPVKLSNKNSTTSHKERTSGDDDVIPTVALPSSFSTPPQKHRKALLTTSSNNDHIQLSGMGPCGSHQDYDNQSFLCALNRAIRMSAAAALETEHVVVIAVTHREGIRSLVDHCRRAGEMIATPYCCIGVFTATVDNSAGTGFWNHGTGDPSITYEFRNVVPYEDFNVDYLRSIT